MTKNGHLIILASLKSSLIYFAYFPIGNRCPLLDPPDNGMLIMPCTPYFNSTCKVGCVNGYVLNGAIDERRCLVGADGQMEWNNNNIQCLGKI